MKEKLDLTIPLADDKKIRIKGYGEGPIKNGDQKKRRRDDTQPDLG